MPTAGKFVGVCEHTTAPVRSSGCNILMSFTTADCAFSVNPVSMYAWPCSPRPSFPPLNSTCDANLLKHVACMSRRHHRHMLRSFWALHFILNQLRSRSCKLGAALFLVRSHAGRAYARRFVSRRTDVALVNRVRPVHRHLWGYVSIDANVRELRASQPRPSDAHLSFRASLAGRVIWYACTSSA